MTAEREAWTAYEAAAAAALAGDLDGARLSQLASRLSQIVANPPKPSS